MLRLWLSLIVEAPKPLPLPNLDFNIETGASLLAPNPQSYQMDITNLGLLMGDEIHFWFIAKDQNNLTKSHKFIGKFPTLEDLFTKMEEYEEDNNEWIDDIQESINEIYETTQKTKSILVDREVVLDLSNLVGNRVSGGDI